ncbi:TlpA disulfide reductase family protein [Pseudoxanthomonas sp. SL93]|uniref:TlpA family protein disulfide reductase n=1 Tax=Pseudoxanthomonas sp. SL93 TaxID=2995142 RepID=UPI0022700215|nr:TlpA disulfide reductase family protein [Pseudoxanthomonas sp. SL93]WAC62044.1 TlpA disulfide reductase family protein [Pseudoxanthomonas sp. SL93]
MKATTPRILLVAVLAGGLGLLASAWFNGNPLWRTAPGERALHAAVNATAPAPPAGFTPAGIGDPMPRIALPGLDGKIVDLAANHPGRRLLINVWASWCGPCIEEMPELERFAASQANDGVQVIGLALDTPEGVRDFLSRVPVSYPIVLDTPGPADASVWLGNAKGVLPYTVLVGADGRIVRQKVGPFQHGEISGWVD